MREKSELIKRLKSWKYREIYIRSKVNVSLPSQIRALRLKQELTQKSLASKTQMKQPRISAMEKPGATKFNIETLVRVAAAFKVGLIVKFAPLSEMLAWENGFSQDNFDVVTFERDAWLLRPVPFVIAGHSLPTPIWVSSEQPRVMHALPKVSHDTVMTLPPLDGGSTSTVLDFQV
jgi:transcriptional regulator with XRE-family HTH domain